MGVRPVMAARSWRQDGRQDRAHPPAAAMNTGGTGPMMETKVETAR